MYKSIVVSASQTTVAKVQKSFVHKEKIPIRSAIIKLEDATYAGISRECTLILTEGDSAKCLAVAGLGVLGREKYGVFPLKGKKVSH